MPLKCQKADARSSPASSPAWMNGPFLEFHLPLGANIRQSVFVSTGLLWSPAWGAPNAWLDDGWPQWMQFLGFFSLSVAWLGLCKSYGNSGNFCAKIWIDVSVFQQPFFGAVHEPNMITMHQYAYIHHPSPLLHPSFVGRGKLRLIRIPCRWSLLWWSSRDSSASSIRCTAL